MGAAASRAEAAAARVSQDEDSGKDSGAARVSQDARVIEDAEETTGKLAVAFDLNVEERSSGGVRRRRRPPRRGREEGEGGDYASDFAEKPVCFSVIAKRSFAALNCGLRVRFFIWRGMFL